MCNLHQIILKRIVAANLEAATERVAIRLLADSDAQYGQRNLTWPDYLALCGCENQNAARRHLTLLKQAKIIHYSTNDYVYVTFIDFVGAWARPGERVGAHRPIHEEVVETATRCGGRVDAPWGARGRAETVLPTNWLVGSYIPNDPDQIRTNQPVATAPEQRLVGCPAGNAPELVYAPADETPADHPSGNPDLTQPFPPPPSPPTADEERRSFALLTDPEIGLSPKKAATYARVHHFAWLVDQVATWWQQLQDGKVESAGALSNRISAQWRPDPITPGFLRSELYRRHYPLPPDEAALWREYASSRGYEDIVIGLPDSLKNLSDRYPPALVALLDALPSPLPTGEAVIP